MTPNGDVCLIDSDRTKSAGHQIAEFLRSAALNELDIIKTLDLRQTTYYDRDHIAGLPRVIRRVTAIFNDQGNVTALVSRDRNRYMVIGGSFARTSSARDSNNRR